MAPRILKLSINNRLPFRTLDHFEVGRIVIDGREEANDLVILWVDDLVEVLDQLPSHLVGHRRQRPDLDRTHIPEFSVAVEALPTSQADSVRKFTPASSGQQIGQPQSRSAGRPSPQGYDRHVSSAGQPMSMPRKKNAYQWAD
jgi:hypothetical protein